MIFNRMVFSGGPGRFGWASLLWVGVGLLLLAGNPGVQAGDLSSALSSVELVGEPVDDVVGDAEGDAFITDPQGNVSVVVELVSEPVIQVYLAALADDSVTTAAVSEITQTQLAAVEAQQTATLAELTSRNIQHEVLYRNQRVYNGMGLLVSAGDLTELEQLPQVAAVHPLSLKGPTTSSSVPHIHAPGLWAGFDGLPGLTGEGIRIAIIDTGIDYLHTAFGGPGSGYGQNITTQIGDVPNFPGLKVVGGWDFAGNRYNADPEADDYAPVPMPNPDPMDCYTPGHGTHVAAIAGGYGVTAAGATYRGPYTDTLAPADFRMGPGVAPRAQLYALKVFGCGGKTALVDAAIEWAVDPNRDGDFSDRVDVINLSLGSGYGAPYDATALAVDNAARLGVVVVASAGNNGDAVYAVGTPGVAEAAISTAATRLESQPCGEIVCPSVDLMADFSARGPRRVDALLKPDVAAPGFGIVSARAGTGTGVLPLSGTSMAAPHVAGAAALLLESMQQHNEHVLAERIATGQTEPALEPDGSPILWQPEDVKARLMNTAVREIQTGFLSDDPFYGPPRIGAGRIDLGAALATRVIAYDADAPAAVGVSYGAPTVLDTFSDLRRVALTNRSSEPITFSVSYAPLLQTPGVSIRLPDADDDGVLPVRLAPYGTAHVHLLLEVEARAMRYVIDPALPPIQTFPRHWLTESTGYLIMDPRPIDGETADDTSGDTGVAGTASVQLSQPVLHVPVYAAPQPVTHLQISPPALDFGKAISATGTVEFVGTDFGPVCDPDCSEWQTPQAAAAIFELHHVRSRRSNVGGLPPNTFEHADLRYIGATQAHDQARSMLYFGVATHGPWSTLNEVEFNIWIDVNGDRQADYRLFNSDYAGYRVGLWSDIRGGDVFITALEDLATGERVLADFVNGASAGGYATGVYNTDIIILPLPLALLDLPPETSRIRYRVTTYSRTFGNHPLRSPVVDATPWLTFQLSPAAIDTTWSPLPRIPSSPLVVAHNGAHFGVDYRLADYRPTAPRGLLIFQQNNVPNRRAQIVPIRFQIPFEQFLPWLERAPAPPVPAVLDGE